MKKRMLFLNVSMIVILTLGMVNGPIKAAAQQAAELQAASTLRADALVLVNSTSADYLDFQHFIQPYLDNFGIPYSVLDIATTAVTAGIGDYAVVITGHRQLDPTHAYLDSTEQGYLTSAVNAGTGLVNFDNVLSLNGSTALYTYVSAIFSFGYTTPPSLSDVSFSAPQNHYITQLHTDGETITTNAMTLAGITLPGGTNALATTGAQPFLAETTYGQGRAVQWGSYNWMSHDVLGPLKGLDDLVWRSIVWAARKPFTLQGLPNFATFRMDDVTNAVAWAPAVIDNGFIPFMALFTNTIGPINAGYISTEVNSGHATAGMHSFDLDNLFYYDHFNSTEFSDAAMADHYTTATQWFSSNNIPISKVAIPHFYEIGSNAFAGLSDWGVEYIGTQMDPGQLESQANWMMKGPYRLYESGAANDMTQNPYYADFMTIPGHPEYNGQFFNCVSEIRDITGYEWMANGRTSVAQATADGTAWYKRSFDSMALGELYSHEYLGAATMPEADWRSILQGITQNIASYQPEYVSLDYACQYVRAMKTSNISSSSFDTGTNEVTINLSGSTDLATQLFVFNESGGEITKTAVDVPVFSGSTQVVYASPSALDHIVVSPSQSDTTLGGTLQFSAQGYDANANPIQGLTYTWAVVNGGGTIDANGLFTAGQIPGVYTDTLSASVGSIQGLASVTVNGPNQGPGGPILVIANSANPFSLYYAEILRAEGLNYFTLTDISQVDLTMLANYKIAILGETPLTAGQVSTLANWVQGGGKLVAMRPDKQLAGLLGLTDDSATLQDGYLQVDTSQAPGSGIVVDTIQYHSTADFYTLNGAAAVATLYSDAATATSHPAVTVHAVGSSGGQAAAFTYDLARSVVYTRQGNPAWAGQERDGYTPIRSDDMFYPDYVNLDKVAIPQADEQQRLLANLMGYMLADTLPMPRFWYLPRSEKAVVIMTGDDHGNNGTTANFDSFISASTPGCSVDDWECIRATSYMYTATALSNTDALAYQNQGFEISAHVNTNCADWTPATLENFYATQIAEWQAKYTSLAAPETHRTHCIVWSDWTTQAEVELSHGIRLDTNYYYWPSSWINNRPGMFTGSGMPMRFVDLNGNMIDVYQATTQITDESGQDISLNIDTLLDNALGATGYYGAFTMNMHNDGYSANAMTIVAAAQLRNVPVVSSLQMLTWLDGRNGSSFGSPAWNGNALSFTINVGTGARGLTAMVPMNSAVGPLSVIYQNGSQVTFTPQTIKGVDYAFFTASAGSYTAYYLTDASSPTITTTEPNSGATTVNVNDPVKATFSEGMTASSVNMNSFVLLDANDNPVPAGVSYDPNTFTATFTPSQPLSSLAVYTATVKGGVNGVMDLGGNPMISDDTWSFTTQAPTAVTISSFSGYDVLNTVNLEWQTATEVNLVGFNLYRSDSLDGAKYKLNTDLIPAQNTGQLLGKTYHFSSAANHGKHYYWLEQVNFTGAELTGPVALITPYLIHLPITRR